MEQLRPHLPKDVLPSNEVDHLPDGEKVMVAGLIIRRQRPLGKAVFITSEDETGHTPFLIWPDTYEEFKLTLKEPLLLLKGNVSRRGNTMNIVVTDVKSISDRLQAPRPSEINDSLGDPLVPPKAKNWS